MPCSGSLHKFIQLILCLPVKCLFKLFSFNWIVCFTIDL